MGTPQAETDFAFGPFRLEPGERRLLRDGVPIPLQPKAFYVLCELVQRCPALVTYDALLTTIWPGKDVYMTNLYANASRLNKILGEHDTGEAYIRNVSGAGYRFIDIVRRVPRGLAASEQPSVQEVTNLDTRFLSYGQRVELTFPERKELMQRVERGLTPMLKSSSYLNDLLQRFFDSIACQKRERYPNTDIYRVVNCEQFLILSAAVHYGESYELSTWKPSGTETETVTPRSDYFLLLSKSYELRVASGVRYRVDKVEVFETYEGVDKCDTFSPAFVPCAAWDVLAEVLNGMSTPQGAIDVLFKKLRITLSPVISDEVSARWKETRYPDDFPSMSLSTCLGSSSDHSVLASFPVAGAGADPRQMQRRLGGVTQRWWRRKQTTPQ
jgi:DNA-binding winged helix-turn-helix (wHTH) protein